ncbi:hypothetical protein GF343_04650 [Candidatus Woesearchaeota archaeon]|nr:hypothetical protein [Candidatus Woesearchaeota archaeon]
MHLNDLITDPKKEEDKQEPRKAEAIPLKDYRKTEDYLRLVSAKYCSGYFG